MTALEAMKTTMNDHRITVRHLARGATVSPTMISGVLNGFLNPSPGTALKIFAVVKPSPELRSKLVDLWSRKARADLQAWENIRT